VIVMSSDILLDVDVWNTDEARLWRDYIFL